MSITAAAPANPIVRQLAYTGKLGPLFWLVAVNWGLTFLTFGVYHFWAKTRLRRFFHENTFFMEEPFTYLGTGREIFFSAMKFVLIFVLPLAILYGVASAMLGDSPWMIALSVIIGLLYLAMRVYARLSGLRYRANRMSWRGIRFMLAVKRAAYLRLVLQITLLNILTLGLYRPYGDYRLLNLFVNHLYYGDRRFSYQGDRADLTRGYIFYWLLALPTFFASMTWYRARLQRHIAKHTRLGELEFRYNIDGGQLWWLGFSNVLLVMVSFGLLGAYALQRRMHLFIATLRLRGMPDFSSIRKAPIDLDGAGAADYLGADEDIGL